MNQPIRSESSYLHAYATSLFVAWLNEHYGRVFAAEAPEGAEGADAECIDGADRVAIAVRKLYDAGDGTWPAERAAVERRLAEGVPSDAYLLWVPPGAGLPAGEPALSAFTALILASAARLAPGERGMVKLPVVLTLKKLEDVGGYISVLGGMSGLWAEFTGRVDGSYRLDSRAVHRLPPVPDYRSALIEAIVAKADETRLSGESATIEAIDAWTLQRLPGGAPPGFALVAAPPSADLDSGGNVRRMLRSLLKESQQSLGGIALKRAYRALVLLGAFVDEANESVSTALRGFDPTIYAAIDFIILLVDGTAKPIYVSPRVRL